MDWSALLSTIAIVVFILLMMRGCGGMMAGGGCGMGVRHRHKRQPNTPGESTTHAGHSGETR
jgi:hypothetical protein